jgi:hypothetical protein
VDYLTSFFSGFHAQEKGMIPSTWVSVWM